MEFSSRLLRAAAAGFVVMLGVSTGARAGLVSEGADYLVSIQDAGGFFHDASPTTFYASTQGQIGLGLLAAYQESCLLGSCNSAYLTSATKLGDALQNPAGHAAIGSAVQQNELYFDAGTSNPIIWSQSTLFLQKLSQVTNNPSYANFLKTELWDKLNAGTYGNDPSATNPNRYSSTGGVNASNWVAVVQTKCDEKSPYCLARTALAAKNSGETGILSDLMVGIRLGLESFSGPEDGTFGQEILALAAAVWVSEVTGIDIMPTTGYWAGLDTTALANQLAALQLPNGGIPAGIYSGAPATDIQTTSTAAIALALAGGHTLDVLQALNFLRSQVDSGCVDDDPGACVQGAHGEVLQFYSQLAATDPDLGDGSPDLRSLADIINIFYVPEPLTVGLFAMGLIGLAAVRRRRAA